MRAPLSQLRIIEFDLASFLFRNNIKTELDREMIAFTNARRTNDGRGARAQGCGGVDTGERFLRVNDDNEVSGILIDE